jgi:cobalamin-dependent methionine synthase I
LIGFWLAVAAEDDIRLFAEETRREVPTTLFTLRQQVTPFPPA